MCVVNSKACFLKVSESCEFEDPRMKPVALKILGECPIWVAHAVIYVIDQCTCCAMQR